MIDCRTCTKYLSQICDVDGVSKLSVKIELSKVCLQLKSINSKGNGLKTITCNFSDLIM